MEASNLVLEAALVKLGRPKREHRVVVGGDPCSRCWGTNYSLKHWDFKSYYFLGALCVLGIKRSAFFPVSSF